MALTGRAPVHWLVSIRWGGIFGGTIRVSDTPLTVVTNHGDLHFAGGLDRMALKDTLPTPGTARAPRSANVRWTNTPIALGIEGGHVFAGAECELALWEEDTPFEERFVALLGRASLPSYGNEDEEVAFRVVERGLESKRLVPDPALMVDDASWGDLLGADNSAVGKQYPVVIGRPGRMVDVSGNGVPYAGSEGYYTDPLGANEVLIAGHHVMHNGDLAMSQDPAGPYFAAAVRNTTDQLGRPVAMASAALGFSTSEPIWVSWSDALAATVYGGHPRLEGDIAARQAHDVIALVLTLGGVDVDLASIKASAPVLGLFLVDAVIEAPTDPVEWVAEAVLALVPAVLVARPTGAMVIVLRPYARPDEASWTLDVDADDRIARVGLVEYDDDVRGPFSLSYAWDVGDSEGRRTLVGAGSTAVATDASAEVLLCPELAVAAGLDLDSEPWEHASGAVSQSQTAQLAVATQAMLWGLPRRSISYMVPLDVAGAMQLGDVVLLSEAGLGLVERVVLVTELEYSDDGQMGLTLTLWHMPGRDL